MMMKLKLFLRSFAAAISLGLASAGATSLERGLVFECGDGVEVHCEIQHPRTPGLGARCWYFAGGLRLAMLAEAVNRFTAGPIRVRLMDGIPLSAGVVNLDTGFRAFCAQE